MEGGTTPWILYFAGAVFALILTMVGVPALAFALGMFIPLDLNTPLLVGGLISWFVSTRSKSEAVNKARKDRGTLIASGFIAGGALMGVISALFKYLGTLDIGAGGVGFWGSIARFFGRIFSYLGDGAFAEVWNGTTGAELLAIGVYVCLIIYFIWDAMRGKEEKLG